MYVHTIVMMVHVTCPVIEEVVVQWLKQRTNVRDSVIFVYLYKCSIIHDCSILGSQSIVPLPSMVVFSQIDRNSLKI